MNIDFKKEYRKKMIMIYLAPLLVIAVLYYMLMTPNKNDIETCLLKDRAIKGRITKKVVEKYSYFFVDSIKEYFPMNFNVDKDSYREFYEVSKGENYMWPEVGDSIFKQPNSGYVMFKRRGKIFIEELALKGCK